MSSSTSLYSLSLQGSQSTDCATSSAESIISVNEGYPKLDLYQIQESLIEIAHQAGEMMVQGAQTLSEFPGMSVEKKNSADRVTETDQAIENMIHDKLASTYPDIEFLGEETFKVGQKLSNRPTFVCDPIDGTLNFIHGNPHCAVSLALVCVKRTVVGVVYNPFRNDLFTAIKGQGGFLTQANGVAKKLPLRQSGPIASLKNCLVALEWGTERQGPNWNLRSDVANKMLTAEAEGGVMVHSIRSLGSAALSCAYVAAGWFDAYFEAGCWVWDIGASWLIVEESGGLVVGANPNDWSPALEGRSYLFVRGDNDIYGQRKIVEQVWGVMGDRRFVLPQQEK